MYRIALAGYTNAGKSSLMNCMTNADVLAYDKFFATLDSTTRQITFEDGCQATLTDTVGFIQKLPHNLVEAFHSTLDEIREADLVLLVVDASSAQREAQRESVQEALCEIGAQDIEAVTVYNKIDLLCESQEGRDELAHLQKIESHAVFVSALTHEGIDALVERLSCEVLRQNPLIEVLIPYEDGRLVELAHSKGVILREEYLTEGTRLSLRIPSVYSKSFSKYAVDSVA